MGHLLSFNKRYNGVEKSFKRSNKKKEGGSMFKKGLQVAEAAAAAYHIGRTVFEVGKFAAPYILAAAV